MTSGAGPAAGVVLAGGRSSRMGTSKAVLEWHGSTLVRRAAGLLTRTVDGPIVVVKAPGQELPPLPAGVEVIDDPVEGRGPLQGIATGLSAVVDRVSAAFVCATDLPFLHPAYVERVLSGLTPEVDVALPVARGHPQPLAAAYRTAIAPHVARLIAAGRLRPATLYAQVRMLRLDGATLLADPVLAAADPELESLINVNEPGEYRSARARPAPEVEVRGVGRDVVVRAATLGAAAAAIGFPLDQWAVVEVDGRSVPVDPQLPLVTGDAVTFRRT